MARISDDEVASICVSEIESASGRASGQIADQRATAMDYYLGEEYGDEVEGRSQIRTREVLDTIESIMPSLIRIFADSDNMVEFDPVSEDDEEQAQQESDVVNYEFWKQNRGFYNIYSFCKDALLSKTGNLKVWWDDSEDEEREEYQGLTEVELGELLADTTLEREILEFEQGDEGANVTFKTVRSRGRLMIEPVTPEEFGINSDARSPYAQDAVFCYMRNRKSYGELRAAGYSRQLLETIPSNDTADTQERLSRRRLQENTTHLSGSDTLSMRRYWVTECYLYLDRDDDGIPELLKVTLAASGQSGATLMDIEDVDSIPFFTASPNVLTHKFHGLSIADLVLDLQVIKSTLVRQLLDSAYLANQGRQAVNELVNLDDLLTSRPGGVVRVAGDGPPANAITPIVNQPLPQETFGLLEYLDELRKDRTGSGDDVPGLDAKSLASVNTGVAALAYDQARARIELIARILAEVAFRPMFKHMHELLQKHSSKENTIKLRGKWVPINPSEWRTRHNMTVRVGIGIASRERRMLAMDAIAEKQQQVIAGGGFGVLMTPSNMWNLLHDFSENWGVEPSRFFQDPLEAQLPQEQDEGPSVQDQALLASAQAQLEQARSMNDRNKVEAAKVQSQERIRQMELAGSEQQLQMKRETEVLKADLQQLRGEQEGASKEAQAMIQAEIKGREQELKAAELRLNDQQENDKRQIEMYRALLQSGTTLTAEQMKLAGADTGGAQGLFTDLQGGVQNALSALTDALRGEMGEVRALLQEQSEASKAPRIVERDGDGLIISVGGRKLARDASGLVQSIE